MRFLQYDSIVNERDYDYYGSRVHNIPMDFPILIACANSMHSRAKMEKQYGHLVKNISILKKGYKLYNVGDS